MKEQATFIPKKMIVGTPGITINEFYVDEVAGNGKYKINEIKLNLIYP